MSNVFKMNSLSLRVFHICMNIYSFKQTTSLIFHMLFMLNLKRIEWDLKQHNDKSRLIFQ